MLSYIFRFVPFTTAWFSRRATLARLDRVCRS